MDEKTIITTISDNSLMAATGSAAFVFFYKFWRILKTDKKNDDLNEAEKNFREEIRAEIKTLKDDKKNCEDEKEKLYEKFHDLQKELAELKGQVSFYTKHTSDK